MLLAETKHITRSDQLFLLLKPYANINHPPDTHLKRLFILSTLRPTLLLNVRWSGLLM